MDLNANLVFYPTQLTLFSTGDWQGKWKREAFSEEAGAGQKQVTEESSALSSIETVAQAKNSSKPFDNVSNEVLYH